jgi:ComF family protein
MLENLLSLFLKSNCPLCDRAASDYVCQYCQRQLQSCQFKNPGQFWSGDLPLFVWGKYQGKLKQAIAAFKYDNSPQLGELMGEWLARSWLDSPISKRVKPIVIPIPLHHNRLQERGFNQAELIAKSFCRVTGDRLLAKGLQRVQDTKAMFGLSALERENNIGQAFCLKESLKQNRPKLPILLIDDIYTTGTTVKAAAKLLNSYHIKVLGVGAIAKPEMER